MKIYLKPFIKLIFGAQKGAIKASRGLPQKYQFWRSLVTTSVANWSFLYSWNIPSILHAFVSFQSLHCYHILNFAAYSGIRFTLLIMRVYFKMQIISKKRTVLLLCTKHTALTISGGFICYEHWTGVHLSVAVLWRCLSSNALWS